MNIETLNDRLRGIKIVPVIALERAEDAVPLGRTLQKNGIPVAEITFRSAAAIDAIRRLRDALPDILIGAGTVLNAAQAKAAQQAGADFIVSPGFNPNTVKACQDLGIAITPGINNPTAIEAALEHGITTVKYFPAEASGGLKMLKALHGPFPQVRFCPTGGIGPAAAPDYLAQPNVLCVGGSWLTPAQLIAEKNWRAITELAEQSAQLKPAPH